MPPGLFNLPDAPEPGQPIRSPFLKELARGVQRANTMSFPRGLVGAAGSFIGAEPGTAESQWYNRNSSTCPQYGVFRIINSYVDNNNGGDSAGFPLYVGDRSNAYGSQYMHRLNGEWDVDEGSWGEIQDGPDMIARYKPSDGTPAIGDALGPRDGEWELRTQTGGFVVTGLIDTTTNFLVRVRQAPFLRFRGKADTAIPAGQIGTVSILWGGRGTYPDTGVNMTTVYADFSIAIAQNDILECIWEGDMAGLNWKAIAKNC